MRATALLLLVVACSSSDGGDSALLFFDGDRLATWRGLNLGTRRMPLWNGRGATGWHRLRGR
jgi:hypothetical protein